MPESMDFLPILHDALVVWMAHGLLDAAWWQLLLYTLVVTHITIAAVTIFLHRAQAHRALKLGPVPEHFFRLWLWLTTGMVTKEFVAVHRKHHAKCETKEDPHSPQTRGIKALLLTGVELYRAEAKVPETLARYGHGTPDDWFERNVYSRYFWQGVGLMLVCNLALFGAIGLTVWAVQMLWIPVMATGIINGIGHWWGYRNFSSPDESRNISPWGVLIGGEELHNNHHTYATSAKFSVKPYEFDVGWLYICAMQSIGWATVQKVPPRIAPLDLSLGQQTWLQAYEHVCTLRYVLLAELDELAQEIKADRVNFAEFKASFLQLFSGSDLTDTEIAQQLEAWCEKAKQSGSNELRIFANRLRSVRVARAR